MLSFWNRQKCFRSLLFIFFTEMDKKDFDISGNCLVLYLVLAQYAENKTYNNTLAIKEMKKLILLFVVTVFFSYNGYTQVAEKAEDISPLLNGETFPDAVLKAPDGTEYILQEILKQKPTVVLFYRGGWCPFCNAHLAEIQNVQNEVVNLGYQIIAISPDLPENLKVTDEKQNLPYSLYSDAEGELIKAIGIAFKAPENYLRSEERR